MARIFDPWKQPEQQIVLVEHRFVREPSLKAGLEDLEYRGLEDCLKDSRDKVKDGDPASVLPVIGEILEAAHPQ